MSELIQKPTSSHWGMGRAILQDGRLVRVEGHPDDPASSPINGNIASSLNGRARVLRPAIRQSWLENGPLRQGQGADRGRSAFVEVSWDKALDLLAHEITRVKQAHGNTAIFAGSYGWSSAGRFHHAQSQLKRFLNTQGGFVKSEGNYSYNAALGLMPHIVGSYRSHVQQATRWPVIAQHGELVVLFGGMAERNTQVSDGGISKHRFADNMLACAKAGVQFVNISPLRSDLSDVLKARWLAPKPGSDTAVMMGLAHTLISEGFYDRQFLLRYTVGWEKVAPYLLGHADGQAKDADWAAGLSGIAAETIRQLARRMAKSRTMIGVAAGVQRGDYGEQPMWMAMTLAAMLGQIGLPGGGFMVGYGVNGNIGNTDRPFRWGTMPQGRNPVTEAIPVAMISEMLLNPGAAYRYQGTTRHFPDIRMLWWAGGNPFHHHQNLNRLRQAFQRPETVVVNELNWTATARHADIVLPIAAAQERCDFGAGKSDNALVPMPQLTTPPGEARVEYDIYSDLAARLGCAEAFTEGRSSEDWLRDIWAKTQSGAKGAGLSLPDWDQFIAGNALHLPDPAPDQVFLAGFRQDPVANPLPTPSGKLELYSETIASFGLDDCPGHAAWFPMRDLSLPENQAPDRFFLLSGQPQTRLHSQLDNGDYSKSFKIQGREPVLIHPADAARLGIADGSLVELFNARGRCIAGARVTDEIATGCLFLWTGAWYDPEFGTAQDRDRHGNPNVLTHDLRSSSLTQSPAAHSAIVGIKAFEGVPPPVLAHEPPDFLTPT